MEQARIKELKKISADIKLGALEAVYSANSGHPAVRCLYPIYSHISILKK